MEKQILLFNPENIERNKETAEKLKQRREKVKNIKPDKVLIFDIKGNMAHFRKFYTNSSSLSYYFPPRTVITGLIAGLLGLPSERFSSKESEIYYEKFDRQICFVGLSLQTKLRKMMQTINYCFTKSDSKKILFGQHTQNPIEILLPENPKEDIAYRIYFFHKGYDLKGKQINIYAELKERLKTQRYIYPPYLGLSEFLASIEFIGERDLIEKRDKVVKIKSVCRLEDVEKINFDEEARYIKEKMPTGFDNKRTPKETNDYLLEIQSREMNLELKEDVVYYEVSYNESKENIMFM